jgi:hypothetical protein
VKERFDAVNIIAIEKLRLGGPASCRPGRAGIKARRQILHRQVSTSAPAGQEDVKGGGWL